MRGSLRVSQKIRNKLPLLHRGNRVIESIRTVPSFVPTTKPY